MADQVHRGLGNAAADRWPLVIAHAIVHERTGVVLDLEVQAAQVPVQRRALIAFLRQQRGIQGLDAGHRLSALSMPNQPLGVIDLCLYSDSLVGLHRLAS